MAHHTEQTGFPNVPIVAGMKIRLRALSPTADAEITGVTCTQFAIYGRRKDTSELDPEVVPPFTLLQGS